MFIDVYIQFNHYVDVYIQFNHYVNFRMTFLKKIHSTINLGNIENT